MLTIYPRTISVLRANAQDGVGAQPYQGVLATNEGTILSGLPASIQLGRRAGQPDPGLPGDASAATGWDIYIPSSWAALGSIKERDVVVDDLGKRFQVVGAYWNILGYKLSTTLLEA